MTEVAIIGAGPAGLIAAERLALAGLKVDIFDRMPSVGRKFLMAGRGGLNLTHSENFDRFLGRYGAAAPYLERALRAFPPDALRAWVAGLGQETFVGSSGRVFPKAFKASPLLRALLRRLESAGVTINTRHRWLGWTADGALTFETPDGMRNATPLVATLLALGGASWPKLGSDGGWVPLLRSQGIQIAELEPANAGISLSWSEAFRTRFAGQPVKRIELWIGDEKATGEMTVTETGLEGGVVYALFAPIRSALERGEASVSIDLKPDLTVPEIAARLERSRKGETDTNFLRKTLALSAVHIGLLRESLGKSLPRDPVVLANAIKGASLELTGVQGLERAISTAGGLGFDQLDEALMIRALPGVFAAGEMLDWEAPTGGYLLQACFASGLQAAESILAGKARA